MAPDLFSLSTLESGTILNPRRWRPFLRSNSALKIRFFSAAFIFTIVYLTVFSSQTPSRHFPSWYLSSKEDTYSVEHPDDYEPTVDPQLTTLLPNPTPEPTILDNLSPPSPSATVLDGPPPPSAFSSPVADVLTVEQIRDIVALTRGFFSRDYDLELGWNNVSVSLSIKYQLQMISLQVRYIFEAALLQAELLNRNLVLPSFVYARACEYERYVMQLMLSLPSFNHTCIFCHPQPRLRGLCNHGQ
jgi:hypothetical protein